MSAQQVAEHIRAAGLPVKHYSEPDFNVDGEVVVSDAVHVQIGLGYVGVVVETEDEAFRFLPARATLDEIVEDITRALCGTPAA